MRLAAGRGVFQLFGALTLLLLCALPAQGQRLQCDRCHGELELLRQRVPNLSEAEKLLVPSAVLHSSAHGELQCAECHTGTAQYPHAPKVTTRTCTSCHAAADSAWQLGVHANVQDRDPVTCTACHGIHDVLSREQLKAPQGIATANAKCVACHESQALSKADAHNGKALCAGCHGAHDVQQPQRLTSQLHPIRQLETCGGCHDSIANSWRNDVHADTLRMLAASGGDFDPETLPGCTSCHGGHGVVPTDSAAWARNSVERCSKCHEQRAKTFYNSYHGKAAALGSAVAATCADCHGSHGIQPSSHAASMTSEANLVQTCAACHEHARPAFVKYDSHPDPFNYQRNPWIFGAFVFMNSMLVMTLLVFGLHTVLWWIRIVIDRRKGVGHGHGHGHDHHDGGVA